MLSKTFKLIIYISSFQNMYSLWKRGEIISLPHRLGGQDFFSANTAPNRALGSFAASGRIEGTELPPRTTPGHWQTKRNVIQGDKWTQQAVPSSIQFYIDCTFRSANEECTNQAISLYVMAAWTFPDPSSVFCCLAMTKVGETKTWSTKNMAAIQITVPSKNQNMFEDVAHLLEAVACFYHLTVLMHDFRSGKMFWTRRLWPNKTFPDGTRQATWETTHLTESHISFFSPSFSHPNGMTWLYDWKCVWNGRSIEYVMFESPSKDSHKH